MCLWLWSCSWRRWSRSGDGGDDSLTLDPLPCSSWYGWALCACGQRWFLTIWLNTAVLETSTTGPRSGQGGRVHRTGPGNELVTQTPWLVFALLTWILWICQRIYDESDQRNQLMWMKIWICEEPARYWADSYVMILLGHESTTNRTVAPPILVSCQPCSVFNQGFNFPPKKLLVVIVNWSETEASFIFVLNSYLSYETVHKRLWCSWL